MFRKKLRAGELDDQVIEIDVADNSNPLGAWTSPASPAGR